MFLRKLMKTLDLLQLNSVLSDISRLEAEVSPNPLPLLYNNIYQMKITKATRDEQKIMKHPREWGYPADVSFIYLNFIST